MLRAEWVCGASINSAEGRVGVKVDINGHVWPQSDVHWSIHVGVHGLRCVNRMDELSSQNMHVTEAQGWGFFALLEDCDGGMERQSADFLHCGLETGAWLRSYMHHCQGSCPSPPPPTCTGGTLAASHS